MNSTTSKSITHKADKPKKAIPAKSDRPNYRITTLNLLQNQPPLPIGSKGMKIRMSTKLMSSNTENKMPVTASSPGALQRELARLAS